MSLKAPTSAADIGSYADGVYALPAKVTHAQAPAFAAAVLQVAQRHPQQALSLDASALREFDSSLLAALMQVYRKMGTKAQLNHAPAQLRELVKVYGVEEAMPAIHIRTNDAEKFASAASWAK